MIAALQPRLPRPDIAPGPAQVSARRRAVVLGTAIAVAVACSPLPASPASAEVLPVQPPQSIHVFPHLDAVRAVGFEEPIVVEVWRDGVKIGSSGEPVRAHLLALNLDGSPCWSGTTPDIVPGDEVRVVSAGPDPNEPDGQYTTVADLSTEAPELIALDGDGDANDLVMKGAARNAEGTGRLPIDSLAAKIAQPSFRDVGLTWDRAEISAESDGQLPSAAPVFADRDLGVLAYDPVGPGNEDGTRWTATWKNLPPPIGTLALSGEHTISFTGNDGSEDGDEDGSDDADEGDDEGDDENAGTEDDDGSGGGSGSGSDDTDEADDSGSGSGSDDSDDADDDTDEEAVDEVFEAGAATITGTEDVKGPRSGCPAAATDAVTTTSVPHINLAARAAGGQLTVGGTAFNAVRVRITVDDADATSADAVTATASLPDPGWLGTTEVPEAGVQQTWTARLPMSAVTSPELADGPLTISGRFDRVEEQRVELDQDGPDGPTVEYRHTVSTVAGRPLTVLKDLVAPRPPTVSPAGGRYYDPQDITVTPADAAQETVRYTAYFSDADEPSANSPEIPAPYEMYLSQQLKVAAYDGAGNRSATVTNDYDLRTRGASTAPLSVKGSPRVKAALVRWSPPEDIGGHDLLNYRVRVFGPDGAVIRQRPVAATSTELMVTGLTNQTAYTFDVTARTTVGYGPASARTGAVTPADRATAPRVHPVNASNGAARLFWNAPADTGGSGVKGYQVRVYSVGSAVRTIKIPVGTSTTVTGLRNSRPYTFDVAALTAVGVGAPSVRTATVVPRAEFVAPTITARGPAANGTAVPQNGDVTVVFSEPVTGVGNGTVWLMYGSTRISATVSYNAANRTATLNPYGTSALRLAADARYTVALRDGTTDAAGNALAPTSWNFTTGPAPWVVSRSPGGDATEVRRDKSITVTFSERVTGLSTGTVQLVRTTTGAAVPGTVTFDVATRTATFNPYGASSSRLASSATYRLTVTSGIRDTAGNRLPQVSWTFKTRAS